MSNERKSTLSRVMQLAWQFIKRNGFSLSEALTIAWRNIKLHAALSRRIVRFYFRKVDGTVREAYGTLAERLVSATAAVSTLRTNDTVQTYYDTERQKWRSTRSLSSTLTRCYPPPSLPLTYARACCILWETII